MDNLYYSAKNEHNDHLISRNGISMLSASGGSLYVSPTSLVCGTQQNNLFGAICASPNSLYVETGRTTASAVNFNTGICAVNAGHVICQSGLLAIGAGAENLYGTEFGRSIVSASIPQVNAYSGLTVNPFETNVHLHNSPITWGYGASQNNSLGIVSASLSPLSIGTGRATVSAVALNTGVWTSPNLKSYDADCSPSITFSVGQGISKSNVLGIEGTSSGSYYIKTAHEGLGLGTSNTVFPSANGLSGIGVGNYYGTRSSLFQEGTYFETSKPINALLSNAVNLFKEKFNEAITSVVGNMQLEHMSVSCDCDEYRNINMYVTIININGNVTGAYNHFGNKQYLLNR